MGKYRVTSPDGQKYEVTAPDDATEDQIMQYAQENMPKQRRTPLQMIVQSGLQGHQIGGMPGAVLGAAYSAGTQLDKAAQEGAYEAGGRVAEKGVGMGLSPETSAKLGYVTNVALQAIPAFVGGGAGREAGKLGGTALQDVGRWFMAKALGAPPKAWKAGDAAVAIDTMLEKGLNPTKAGVQELRDQVSRIHDEVKTIISNSPGTVNKVRAAKELEALHKKFLESTQWEKDTQTVRAAWEEFRDNPLIKGKIDIPVQLAHEMKSNIQHKIASSYGQMGNADIQSQKALARGLRLGVAEAEPAAAEKLAEEARLIKTLNLAERKAYQELSRSSALGLSPLTSSPAKMMAYLADKSATFKSLVARMLYTTGKAGSGAGMAGGAVSLSNIGSGEIPNWGHLTPLDQVQ